MSEQGVLRADQIGATAETFPLFRCPECGWSGVIDDDQFRGRVSIQCPVCPYHQTKNWSGQPPGAIEAT